MNLVIKLQGGAELVSGDLHWTGPAEKGQKRTFNLSVRAPAKGIGRVVSEVSFEGEGRSAMKRTAHYVLGADDGHMSKNPGVKKKDSKGRDIIEYE
jgi:hypothetical protein